MQRHIKTEPLPTITPIIPNPDTAFTLQGQGFDKLHQMDPSLTLPVNINFANQPNYFPEQDIIYR